VNPRTLTGALLLGAIVLLAVALVGQATDAFADDAVDVLALIGLGLLAVGQAIRAAREQSTRAWVILLLILALAAFVLFD
jgi:hypothetical protein